MTKTKQTEKPKITDPQLPTKQNVPSKRTESNKNNSKNPKILVEEKGKEIKKTKKTKGIKKGTEFSETIQNKFDGKKEILLIDKENNIPTKKDTEPNTLDEKLLEKLTVTELNKKLLEKSIAIPVLGMGSGTKGNVLKRDLILLLIGGSLVNNKIISQIKLDTQKKEDKTKLRDPELNRRHRNQSEERKTDKNEKNKRFVYVIKFWCRDDIENTPEKVPNQNPTKSFVIGSKTQKNITNALKAYINFMGQHKSEYKSDPSLISSIFPDIYKQLNNEDGVGYLHVDNPIFGLIRLEKLELL